MRGHILMRSDGTLFKIVMFIEKTNAYVCKAEGYINAMIVPKSDVIATVNPKDFNSYEELMDHFEIIIKLQNLNLSIIANLGSLDDLFLIWWGKDLEEAKKALITSV